MENFNRALESKNISALKDLFAPECYWRDLVSFTWNIKTMEGRDAIGDMAAHTLDNVAPTNWQIDGDPTENDGITEAWITFETVAFRGRGHLRLTQDGCWTLLTTAQELKGFEEEKGAHREHGVAHGAFIGRETWLEHRQREEQELGYRKQPYVVIIGGGQGGIGLGARLRRLNVPTIIIEKNARPGDSWRNRYKSLCLHDPVWYDHLPYIPFPDHWPVFSPKDKIGDWLESYTKIMELNYWTKSICTSAHYDPETHGWNVEVERDGEKVILNPKQLIIAAGMSAVPNMPKLPGMEKFNGDLHHSSEHPGPDNYRDKKVVIVGSNNSAHDIAAALWESDADVTMVQRSSTHIVKSETLMDIGLGDLYSERAIANGIDHNMADLIFASVPYKVLPALQVPLYDKMKERDSEFYDRLEASGFKLDWGTDGSGLFMKYLRRGSGYYIDVGASELVADGKIKLVHGQVTEITPKGLKIDNRTEITADAIVFATGYSSMNGWAEQLIGKDVADKVGKCWGLGSDTPKDPGPWEGELRNMWKPTQQDALWFHGGNLHQSRHYSQFLSLQLKARMEGFDTPVYGLQDVYHTH
ncbi:MAG: NAD(P)/FAD-dependent oxidoreductase [Aestuariivita sp.]|nr:NAD(P)/FAD-dependent oxidoreductase [Aestuariivita sp.]